MNDAPCSWYLPPILSDHEDAMDCAHGSESDEGDRGDEHGGSETERRLGRLPVVAELVDADGGTIADHGSIGGASTAALRSGHHSRSYEHNNEDMNRTDDLVDNMPYLWSKSVFDQLYVPIRVNKRKRKYVPPQVAREARLAFDRHQTMIELQKQQAYLERRKEWAAKADEHLARRFLEQSARLEEARPPDDVAPDDEAPQTNMADVVAAATASLLARSNVQAAVPATAQEKAHLLHQQQLAQKEAFLRTMRTNVGMQSVQPAIGAAAASATVASSASASATEAASASVGGSDTSPPEDDAAQAPLVPGQFDDDEDDPTLSLVDQINPSVKESHISNMTQQQQLHREMHERREEHLAMVRQSPAHPGVLRLLGDTNPEMSQLQRNRIIQFYGSLVPSDANAFQQALVIAGQAAKHKAKPKAKPVPKAKRSPKAKTSKPYRPTFNPPNPIILGPAPPSTKKPMVYKKKRPMAKLQPEELLNLKDAVMSREEAIGNTNPTSIRKPPEDPDTTPNKNKKIAPAWSKKFELLKEFSEIHGHTDVPPRYEKDHLLSRWARQQRYQYKLFKEGRIPNQFITYPERLDLLNTINFTFKYIENKAAKEWEDGYQGYMDFIDDPNKAEQTSPSLGRWIREQRRNWRLVQKGWMAHIHCLTKDRMARLKQLNFDFKYPTETGACDESDEDNGDKDNDTDEDKDNDKGKSNSKDNDKGKSKSKTAKKTPKKKRGGKKSAAKTKESVAKVDEDIDEQKADVSGGGSSDTIGSADATDAVPGANADGPSADDSSDNSSDGETPSNTSAEKATNTKAESQTVAKRKVSGNVAASFAKKGSPAGSPRKSTSKAKKAESISETEEDQIAQPDAAEPANEQPNAEVDSA